MSEKPSVSDEEWASFVESAREQGLGTQAQDKLLRKAKAPKRPKPPKAPKPPKRQEPAGWRTGPAWQEINGTGRRRRRAKAALGITLVAALALVAVRPQLVTDHLPESMTSALPSSWTGRPEDTTPLAAETARPTAPPETVDPHRPTLEEPFKGSPALRWANGAAGIEPPPAKATGWMSKDQVTTALKRSKEFLVASNLDPATLGGKRPDAAIELLDPRQEDVRGVVDRMLTKPSEKHNPIWLFSRFDPAETRLVGHVVKTRGRMTLAEGKQPGEVLVHADYTFVYPVVKTRPGFDEVARTIVRRQMTFALYDPSRIQATPGKLFVLRWDSTAYNDACSRRATGFLHPEFSEDWAGKAPNTGPDHDPYDRTKDLDHEAKGCGRVSRT
ncbi:hypothetical protein [Streptomyces sp. NPDC094032]|uniref:hypothetical protein n=1 Tax=Streptomyces sp. NPDC094032 TaxID=3155308 RepID=UPI003330AD80